MINVILAFHGKVTRRDRRIISNNEGDWVTELPEGRNINSISFCQLLCKGINQFENIKAKLEANDRIGEIDEDTGEVITASATMEVVGIWYADAGINGNKDPGLLYGYKFRPNGTITTNVDFPSPYPFNLTLYTSLLQDVISYVDGVETSRRRPTEAEASLIDVNKFMGMPDRILIGY